MKNTLITIFIAMLMSCSTTDTNFSIDDTQVLEEAIPIKIVPPRYPRRAAIDGVEGYVRYIFDVRTDGRIENVRKLKSYPEGVFDYEASQVIKKWRFKPAQKNGEPVKKNNLTYTIEFKMG